MPDPFISEVKFLGAGNQDFIELALHEGSDPSGIQIIVYHPNGSVRTTNELSDPDNTMAGKDIYTIDAANSDTFNGVHKNGALAVVEDGEVVQFISFESEVTANNGPAAGMSSTVLGGTGKGESLESRNGDSYEVNEDPSKGTIPCFLAGTHIATDRGEVAVENLTPGDRVITGDSGLQKIVWTGARKITFAEMADPKSRPIRIPAHALGFGSPKRDTFVSPNHRILISHSLGLKLFGQFKVFVAAKFLVGYNSIGPGPVALPVWYHHFLCESHNVVRANGLPAESLYHGPIAGDAFADRSTLSSENIAQFKKHKRPAHRILKAREARELIAGLNNDRTFHLEVS